MKKVALAGCIALIFLYDISDGGADSDHRAYGKNQIVYRQHQIERGDTV